jgi:hypothetical protein
LAFDSRSASGSVFYERAEPTMTMHWQIQRDIAQTRLDDTMRAAKYAHHRASLRRRRTRRMTSILLRVSDWLERSVRRATLNRGGRVSGSRAVEVDVPDVRLTVFPLEGPTAGSEAAG